MQTSSVPKPKRAVTAALLCVAVLGLTGTACSGDSGDSGGSGGSSSSGGGKSDEDQAVAHRKCLRDHGLKVPEPKGGGSEKGITIGGDDKGTVEKAVKACRDKAPKGMGDGKASQADKDKLVKYAACMRKNGVDMPMPKGDGAVRALPMPKGEAEKQQHKKAAEACKGVMR